MGLAAKNARVNIGGTPATVNRFDVDGVADEIDDSTFESSNSFSEWLIGLKDATISLAGRWEAPQASVAVGSSTTLQIFAVKPSSSPITPLMNVLCTGYKVTGEVRGRIEFEGTFRVTGAF